MKRLLLIILSLIIVVSGCGFISYYDKRKTVSKADHSSRYTVVIDAGHGGKDDGTHGVDKTPEKVINLEIALALYDFLNVIGINCVLIRNGDYEFYKAGEERIKSDLYNRLDFVNSVDNSVLISIHQNHFENESEWGTQIWYSANTEESKLLADSILETVKSFIQPENKRSNKESDDSYYLLFKATVPSIMIECGFMSNERENALLKQDEYQKDMAFCIMSGVSEII